MQTEAMRLAPAEQQRRLSKAGVFDLLGYAPPPPSLSNFTRAPPPPNPPPPFYCIHTKLLHEHKHKNPLKLLIQRIVFLLLFLINIIYIRNAWIRYIDVHLIFILLFTFTYNNRLCLRGYSSQRFSTRGRHESECGTPC